MSWTSVDQDLCTQCNICIDKIQRLSNIEVWNDVTHASTVWFRASVETARKDGPPPLSRAILMGPEFPIKAGNVLRSLEEDRLRVVQAILTLGF